MKFLRRSILLQILIPLVLLQGTAIALSATVTAVLAARRSEREIVTRLNDVLDTLGPASFPFTASVLDRMHRLSGADFVAYDKDGRAIETTLGEPPPPYPAIPAQASRIESPEALPTMVVGRTRYYAAGLRPASGSRAASLLVLYPETGLRQARREAALPPLLLGGASLALTGLAAAWIAHRIRDRIRHVQRQVAEIADGRFRELALGPERDEVDDLSRSINRMCVQLREMQRTIRQSERTRLLAQLAAGLAHQLRNSLTGARMSVQLHLRRCQVADGDRSLDVAIRQLEMTEEHVKGLLSLGRVERRPPEPCDARRIVNEVAELVHPASRHAKVVLHSRTGEGPLECLVERSSVRAAVLNLTLNAVEAAGAGGEVTLEALSTADGAAIDVSDTGPGPPPELAETLYDAFITGKPEGVGLGLALAHQVAVEHGGHLSWTRSDGMTRFRLELPRVPETARGLP